MTIYQRAFSTIWALYYLLKRQPTNTSTWIGRFFFSLTGEKRIPGGCPQALPCPLNLPVQQRQQQPERCSSGSVALTETTGTHRSAGPLQENREREREREGRRSRGGRDLLHSHTHTHTNPPIHAQIYPYTHIHTHSNTYATETHVSSSCVYSGRIEEE